VVCKKKGFGNRKRKAGAVPRKSDRVVMGGLQGGKGPRRGNEKESSIAKTSTYGTMPWRPWGGKKAKKRGGEYFSGGCGKGERGEMETKKPNCCTSTDYQK